MIKEGMKYIAEFAEIDTELCRDLLVAERMKEAMEETETEKASYERQFEIIGKLDEVRNASVEKLKTLDNKWKYFLEVFLIDEDSSRYIYDEFIVNDKDKRLMKTNIGRKIDDITTLENKIKEGIFSEYEANAFLDRYSFQSAGKIVEKIKSMMN